VSERVLVTGSSGLIGSATVRHLREIGYEIREFDTTREQAADVRDREAVERAIDGCAAVVHLAGIAGPELADPITGYGVNAHGTFTVLSAAAAAGVRKIVYASSINASGLPLGVAPTHPSAYPYCEQEQTLRSDWYSLSKQANEQAAQTISASTRVELTGLRFPLVRDITAASFAGHLRRVLREAPLRAAAEGWSYLDVTDSARAVAAALTHTTPAAPGVLVAASRTFLGIETAEAVARFAPGVPCAVHGRGVGLDLSLAENWLDFRAQVYLDDVNPAAVVTAQELAA
jgi:nucleoside-diphosphate-sugar epimerase